MSTFALTVLYKDWDASGVPSVQTGERGWGMLVVVVLSEHAYLLLRWIVGAVVGSAKSRKRELSVGESIKVVRESEMEFGVVMNEFNACLEEESKKVK
jgi:hypothetical protein